MRGSIRTAVFAAADSDVRRQLPFLLAAQHISLLDAVSDGLSAKEAVCRFRPDLLVADTLLPGRDGCSVAESLLSDSCLPVHPALLLLYRREFPVPKRAKLEDMGTAFLAWPAGNEAFHAAVKGLQSKNCSFPEIMSAHADALLDSLGLPEHTGREALKRAAMLCARDQRLLAGRSKKLYPMVGEMLGLSSSGVERALRHAIGAAWQSDKFENQHRIFADTVDARRGQPTCGEMIARLADILRLEG